MQNLQEMLGKLNCYVLITFQMHIYVTKMKRLELCKKAATTRSFFKKRNLTDIIWLARKQAHLHKYVQKWKQNPKQEDACTTHYF